VITCLVVVLLLMCKPGGGRSLPGYLIISCHIMSYLTDDIVRVVIDPGSGAGSFLLSRCGCKPEGKCMWPEK
jgi:hypothetical protein